MTFPCTSDWKFGCHLLSFVTLSYEKSCDPDMDSSSTIYVREKGSLRRVGDIVLGQPKPVSSCRRTNPFVLRKEHFIFTYNEEGSLRYTSKSLFDIALLFVADNIQHVDSLVDFPEQIGDRLFVAVEENRIFSNPDVSPKAMKLFSDAYGDLVLRSLCLRNRFPLFHEKINEIKTFHGLRTLDLFGCRLGDAHEIFQHLTSSLMTSLEQLFIGGNSISDVGLQRLTAPVRMMKKGLDSLKSLDISYNPVTERAFKYLMCLTKLEKLDVSGTGMKLGPGLKRCIRDYLGLIHAEKALDDFDHSKCKTEGWAEQVVNQWETSGTQMPKLKKLEESRTSALRFFGRQKFVRDILNAAPVVHENDDDPKETLHFYKGTDVLKREKQHTPTACTEVKTFLNGSSKRPRKSAWSDSEAPLTKRSSALTEEDMALLNSY
ncbi:leucine-rich repeat-containing protein 42 isoform X2 [Periophthalmus magnuspinnatus]|uniref:leucine-rich repeat-containing protein 42 isoform X2 n=1 Tax=Periophthalmus magnuspinnatus TaxID=409849 RepID=UPI00145BC6DA|nr:leucine-rich repeat-containing protein 42 isoform X2 [Periophthalmus magnuspinnatus]